MCTPELSKAEDGKINFNNLGFPNCNNSCHLEYFIILLACISGCLSIYINFTFEDSCFWVSDYCG